MEVMAGRVRYQDGFEKLHRDERDDFEQLRYEIGDALLDAASAAPAASLATYSGCHAGRLS